MRQLKITPSITNRDSASLEKYLQEIGKEEMIAPSMEPILAQKIRQGDAAALDKLVRANLRFVVSVAKQYQNQGLSLLDLINEGNLGLIKAAKKFDETKGFKFISYAVWWIRQSILQALAEQARIVRLPLNKLGALNKIKKAFVQLEQKYEREPSAEELSQILEMSEEQVSDTLGVSGRAVSVDAPFDSKDDQSNLLDVLSNPNSPSADTEMIAESMQQDIIRSLNTLPPKESDVLKLFYGIGHQRAHTLEEISMKLEMTRERVRQIKDNGIKRLRHNSRSKLLRTYFE
ncbi:MAG: sigma-70 family RNA polymerase sigma factor [Bacteroidetes bacterium]|nr:sigma-70 family RNA polymerase sigma factor [Bacteroidota bacterium]MBK7387921.1 sigma-70 family RNA polymerase sigma factor [Bacteroidota bacterium]MBK7969153.1 sigma-70 family RNA polymerase sigma factor [Bacteroidota bacterium]MBK8413370.1 sigma-70 family RNA polymerase sigma factor [Bacteroidota bacterium]MBK8876677.1 sigma-70 family RNA polymerase sigma factor [Bacteroidota bacterium]